MNVDIRGIDLAKRVFQLHGADRRGRALHRARVSRSELMETARQLQPHTIAMTACSSSYHWARQSQALGIEVKRINPHSAQPFVKTNKNDRSDAGAIVEAACRPSMNFVLVMCVEQQDIQAILRTRPAACAAAHRTHQSSAGSARRKRHHRKPISSSFQELCT